MENSCINRERLANQLFAKSFYDKKQHFHSLDKTYTNTKEVPSNYPSAYRPNVLVMLAKRLMDEGYEDVSCGLIETENTTDEEMPLDVDQIKVTIS